MRKSTIGAIRVCAAVVAVVAVALGATACQGGEDGKAAGQSVRPSASATGTVAPSGTVQAVQAAWKQTEKAHSAKVRMTITTDGPLGAGRVEMSGVQGWGDVPAMDVTMRTTGSLKAESAAVKMPEDQRVIMLGTRQYLDIGPELANRTGGKRWMRMPDRTASSAQGAGGAPTGMSSDPAEQLGVLLHSPSVRHLGTETVDGTVAEHYKGLITFEEMAAVSPKAAAMPPERRQRTLDAARNARIKGYDTDVWLDRNGYPVRMKVVMDSPFGAVTLDGHYSGFGTPITISEPDAEDVFDPEAL
ncbi:hypothetical protein [Streptomyces sp. NPDC051211]|uniref:hypothetical protein n=1 Tax=Streptomyces sp. NPDC051211 TaxID=3154643 RepID=UPI00344BB19C